MSPGFVMRDIVPFSQFVILRPCCSAAFMTTPPIYAQVLSVPMPSCISAIFNKGKRVPRLWKTKGTYFGRNKRGCAEALPSLHFIRPLRTLCGLFLCCSCNGSLASFFRFHPSESKGHLACRSYNGPLLSSGRLYTN